MAPPDAKFIGNMQELPRRWRKGRAADYDISIHHANRREAQQIVDTVAGDAPWSKAGNAALVGLLVLAIGYTLYFVQPVLVPVVLAWVVGTIFLPVVTRLTAAGIPRGVAVVAVVVLLLAVLVGLIAVLSVPVSYWAGRASELGVLLREKLRTLDQPLDFLRDLSRSLGEISGERPATAAVTLPAPGNIVSGILSVLTPAVTQLVLFFGALTFYLIYQGTIRRAGVFFFRERESRLTALRILTDIDDNMSVYFGTFTIINVCLGLVTMLITWAAGLPNPLLWGVLAAVLNFIPYIGPAIVCATLAVVGFIATPTLGMAAVAPLAFVATTTIEGQFVTPTILGHRLTMNPFLVFLAIAFWTWLWGPVGAFLAVPVVMTATVVTRHLFGNDLPDLPE